MSKALVSKFITANATAYAGACTVFKAIESQDFTEQLAELGITGADVKPFAVAYVSEAAGKAPHEYRGTLVFTAGSSEANRVNYLVRVVNGQAEKAAAKRKEKESASIEITAQQLKAIEAALKAFGGDAKALVAAVKSL